MRTTATYIFLSALMLGCSQTYGGETSASSNGSVRGVKGTESGTDGNPGTGTPEGGGDGGANGPDGGGPTIPRDGWCKDWQGGFCEDFDGKGVVTPEAFPIVGSLFSTSWLSSTDPGYAQSCRASQACAPFLANERLTTVVEDGNFGMGILRVQQPFDFAGRTGHIHFEVDMKVSARRYLRVMLSPELAKVVSDDRNGVDGRPANAFEQYFINGEFKGTLWKAGGCGGLSFCHGNAFHVGFPRYVGKDGVLDKVDIYVSRTTYKVVINGTTYVDEKTPDLGFDRAYVYLTHASYNPCKDGECSDAEQRFHWDNIAFDGPVLGKNTLTPAGYRDVVFNVWSATSCTVKGVPAKLAGPSRDYIALSWVARLPAGTDTITPADIACTYFDARAPGAKEIEIVAP